MNRKTKWIRIVCVCILILGLLGCAGSCAKGPDEPNEITPATAAPENGSGGITEDEVITTNPNGGTEEQPTDPAETEPPEETPAPEESTEPEETPSPTPTEEPIEFDIPDETAAPSGAATATPKPAQSEKPTATPNPGETPDPNATAAPGETESPAPGDEPIELPPV